MLSRRGFFGAVAGVLAACKLAPKATAEVTIWPPADHARQAVVAPRPALNVRSVDPTELTKALDKAWERIEWHPNPCAVHPYCYVGDGHACRLTPWEQIYGPISWRGMRVQQFKYEHGRG